MIERQALTVTQVNLYIKQVIARDDILNNVLVKGELSNFKAHSSGHMYMSLKDADRSYESRYVQKLQLPSSTFADPKTE